jgi:hypothetical protein
MQLAAARVERVMNLQIRAEVAAVAVQDLELEQQEQAVKEMLVEMALQEATVNKAQAVEVARAQREQVQLIIAAVRVEMELLLILPGVPQLALVKT